MSNLNIKPEMEVHSINLDLGGLDINNNNSMGIELLANPAKGSVPIDTKSSSPTIVKEDLNLFDDDNMDINNIELDENIPIENDPILKMDKKLDDKDNEYRPIHEMSANDIKNEKIELIYKFKRLEKQGINTTMNYNMNSQLEDMRNEYIKLKKQRETDNAIKFQRKMLMACITGIEFLNGKFDPFSVKLDGWSESMNENINDYD